MKKHILVAAVAAMTAMPAFAVSYGSYGASSADLTGAPATRTRTVVNTEKYPTRTTQRTYTQRDPNNTMYYQPGSKSGAYRQYAGQGTTATTTTTQQVKTTTRSETVRQEVTRKYYLAHPFFQQTKLKFGSVTDLAYNTNSYDVTITPFSGFTISDPDATWKTTQFTVKEDLSFGITDTLAILGMARYDSSDYKVDWAVAPDDKLSDSGINLYGLGLQWRFIDNSEWIGTLSGYYQRQTDVANTVIADLKGGYKIGRSTIYGLLRGWYVMFDENSYGNGINDDNGNAIFLAYQVGDDSAFYVEGGLGVFSVLHEDWTLNVEGIFGNYDWHNQAAIKAAIGWQPGNWFALNLYGKAALYDSADGKDLGFYWMDSTTNGMYEHRGTAELDSYSEWSVGLQAILYF